MRGDNGSVRRRTFLRLFAGIAAAPFAPPVFIGQKTGMSRAAAVEAFASTFADPARSAAFEQPLTLETITKTMEFLKKNNAPTVDGHYLLAVPPENRAAVEDAYGAPKWSPRLNAHVYAGPFHSLVIEANETSPDSTRGLD